MIQFAFSTEYFPLTLALSLREREQREDGWCLAMVVRQTPARVGPSGGGPFSLSPRERAGVRGNRV